MPAVVCNCHRTCGNAAPHAGVVLPCRYCRRPSRIASKPVSQWSRVGLPWVPLRGRSSKRGIAIIRPKRKWECRGQNKCCKPRGNWKLKQRHSQQARRNEQTKKRKHQTIRKDQVITIVWLERKFQPSDRHRCGRPWFVFVVVVLYGTRGCEMNDNK